MGDLYEHFMEMGLEIHMFASQWFLTLFTAKFPLFLVFHILDLFLCEVWFSQRLKFCSEFQIFEIYIFYKIFHILIFQGKDIIFNVAIALLKVRCQTYETLILFYDVELYLS